MEGPANLLQWRAGLSVVTETEPAMFTVEGFCRAHGISKAFFYKLHKEGKAPRLCKLGRKSLITAESARAWRRELEKQAA